jgi:hypothetical protein
MSSHDEKSRKAKQLSPTARTTLNPHGRRTEVNRSTTVSRARFRIIRANGKVEQHILIFDPAELHSLRVNVFVELHPGDRLEQARPKTPDGNDF